MKEITLDDVSKFLDLDTEYIKNALGFFAPELMLKYRDEKGELLEDDSVYKFEDTVQTWKLISFSLTNAMLADIVTASQKIDEAIDILGV